MLRTTLLATVSAAALVFAAPWQARAQDAGPAWWASVEGQYTFTDGTAFTSGYDGDPFSVGPDDGGWAARLKLGGKISPDWFAEMGLRYGKSDKGSDSYYSYFTGFEGSYKEDHLVLDLSVGRDVGLGGGGSARAFAGLRFVRFDGDGTFSSYSSFGSYGAAIDSEHRFTGFGPRAGVDALIPIAGNARFDVGVAGALLYGKRKVSISGYYYSEFGGTPISASDKDNVWVPNIEASAALTYLFTPNASVSAGYRVEKFWNIMPNINFYEGPTGDDRLIHGPFLQVTISGN